MTERFNLATFTDELISDLRELISDLRELRSGKISARDAKARADLAKQVLRSVHYMVTAQKMLSEQAKQIGGGTNVQP